MVFRPTMIGVKDEYPPRCLSETMLEVEITNRDPRMENVNVELENHSLWREFFQCGTEMILTKLGRRMFPDLKFTITGLEANQYYFVLLDIVPVDDFRYKFMGKCWVPAYKSDAPPHKRNMYCHPDSPALGAKWGSMKVTFNKLKLTNNISPNSYSTTDSLMVLNSMHRYVPRLHIYRGSDIARLDMRDFTTFRFPATTFMAVTAYQNEAVTLLKIKFNPFAKGFRDDDRRQPTKRTADDAGVVDDLDSPGPKTTKDDLGSTTQDLFCPSLPGSPTPGSSSSELREASPVPSAAPPLPAMPFSPPAFDPSIQFRTPFDPRFLATSNNSLPSSWRDLFYMHSAYALNPWLTSGTASPYLSYRDPRFGHPNLEK